jgi:ferric-dicitrate binding protein FerR (iron transport regulator)
MNNQSNIEDLLRKFKRGNLSPQEAKELASVLKEGDSNTTLKNTLDNYWQNSSNAEFDVPTDKLLKNLRHNLKNDFEKRSVSFKERLIITLKPVYKYAAIIIVTMGLTWFAKDFFFTKNFNYDTGKDAVSEITVSYGSKSKVILPDGSVVKLNSGSTLRYPSHFDRSSRNVYIEGEAFFDVKKDAQHPFFVKTKEITIKVLGTKFNVKSYADEKTIQTTLVTGSIEIYSNKSEITEKTRLLVLQPNQQATFEKTTEEISVTRQKENSDKISPIPSKQLRLLSEVDVNPIIAWKDNRLTFRDERFIDLSKKLERWYDVEIEIKNDDLTNVLFSGVFVKETIEQALNALKLTTPFTYEMKKNHIIISKRLN